MKKLLVLVVLFFLSVLFVYAQERDCYVQYYPEYGYTKKYCTVPYDTERPSYVPDSAGDNSWCNDDACYTIYSWKISPLDSPLTSPLPVMPKQDIPTSGYVNGVLVPVYGLPCDQVYVDGSESCMCFYQQEQWCN